MEVKGNCGRDRGKRKISSLHLSDSELQVMSERVQLLEEETSNMRKQMRVCLDERRQIITDILDMFNDTMHNKKERRNESVGLLQALCEGSNPGLLVLTKGSSSSSSSENRSTRKIGAIGSG